MRVAFHALTWAPPCVSPACLSDALDAPILRRVFLEDAVGVPYAFDVRIESGMYLLLLAIAVRAWVVPRVVEAWRESQE